MASPPPPAPPPPRLGRPPRWGLGDAVLAFVLATLGGAVGETIAVVVSGTKSAHGVIPITAPVLAGAVVGQYGAWLAWIYAASRFKGFGNLRADFGLVVDVVRDWAMLPLGLGFEIVAGIVILPISNLRSTTPQEVVNELEHARGAKLAVLAVTAVLIAPVVEELFFRGLLLRSLQRRVPAPTAVAISALAFGLAHVVFDFGSGVVLPALVALGMISGILAVRTGNLSRSILLHAGFNLFAVLAVLTKR